MIICSMKKNTIANGDLLAMLNYQMDPNVINNQILWRPNDNRANRQARPKQRNIDKLAHDQNRMRSWFTPF